MVRDPHVLTSFLYENPQAWPVRMALIEEMVRDGDIARAKALVRESPSDSPMPPEYPMRIHALMTDGVKGLESLPPLLGFLPRTDQEEPASKNRDANGEPSGEISASPDSTRGNALAELEPSSRDGDQRTGELDNEFNPVPAATPHPCAEALFDFEERVGEISEDGGLTVAGPSLKGGLGALVESRPIRLKKGPKPPAPDIDRKVAGIRWENYAGKLHLTGGELPDGVRSKSRAPDRFSAFSVAVIFHLLIALLVSRVAPYPVPLVNTILVLFSLLPFLVGIFPAILTNLKNEANASARRAKFQRHADGGMAFHTCHLCGITDEKDPNMEFRVSAEDGEEYCLPCREKKK